jgi:hypothetical protein
MEFPVIAITLAEQARKSLRIASHASLPDYGSQSRTLALSGSARFPVTSAQ